MIAATDYMRNYADQVRSHIPRRYVTLGTDGFGRSDYRVQLRRFFEVNRYYVAVAALKALADDGEIKADVVAQAIKKYGLDTERPDPVDGLSAWPTNDRGGEGPGHRRFQGRAGDRSDGEGGRHRESGGLAGHARVGQGDDGRARAVCGHGEGVKVKVGDKVSEGSLILLLVSGAPAVAAAAEHHKAAVSAPPAPTSAPAGVAEVRVPDIGDFKDVPVIEVMVKPGDTVKPEDALVTLESDKATMDVPAPLGGVVREIAVKVGDKVSEGALVLTLVTDARRPRRRCRRPAAGAEPPSPRAVEDRARALSPRPPAASAAAVDEAGVRARLRGPWRAQARARARRGPRRRSRAAATRAASSKEDVEAAAKGAPAGQGRHPRRGAASAASSCCRGRRSTSRSSARSKRSRCRASRRSPAPTCTATG